MVSDAHHVHTLNSKVSSSHLAAQHLHTLPPRQRWCPQGADKVGLAVIVWVLYSTVVQCCSGGLSAGDVKCSSEGVCVCGVHVVGGAC